MIIDNEKKISRLNASDFNGLVVVWKAWKEWNVKIKADRGEPANNPPMLKLVFFSRIQEFQI